MNMGCTQASHVHTEMHTGFTDMSRCPDEETHMRTPRFSHCLVYM